MRSRITGIVVAAVLALALPAAALAYAPRSAPVIDTSASTCTQYAEYTSLDLSWRTDAGKPRTIQVNTYSPWRLSSSTVRAGFLSMGDGMIHTSFTVTLTNRMGSDTETIVCPPRT